MKKNANQKIWKIMSLWCRATERRPSTRQPYGVEL